MLRVGVIGMGIMGADHAATLQGSVSGASVTMVADIDSERAAAMAGSLGCRSTTDMMGLIGDADVDAVVVASPDATHPSLVRACVGADKPVLCEKPLAPSAAEGMALLADIGDRADLVSLGFMRRFDPGYTELKAAIGAGTVGQPLLLHSVGRGVSGGPQRTDENSVTNSAIHDLDVVPWLLDSPVVEVSWHAPKPTRAVAYADPQLMLLRTADGVLATVETFLNAEYGYDIRCEVVGESGTVSLVEPTRTISDRAGARRTDYPADWRPRFADAYRLELQAWVNAVRGGPRGPLATARDGLVASMVADAVIASMHAGGATVAVTEP